MSTEVDDETILDVLRSSDEPRLTTTEVAEELPVTRGTTRARLQQLADDGRLEREKSGNHVVWWLADGDEAEPAEEDTGAEASDDGADGGDGDESESERDADREEGTDGEAESGFEFGSDSAASVGSADAAGASMETETGTSGDDADGDDTDVPVEAVSPDGTVGEASEGSEERRPTPPEPALGRDEEGLRAAALVAAVLVVLLLFRRLLGDDENP